MREEQTGDDEAVEGLIRLLSRVGRLEALPRTGWVFSGVVRPESIAAHSYEVAVVALWLADRHDEEVDVERVLRIALLHDVGEALLGDLPAPVKAFLGREAVREAEREAVDVVLEQAPASWRQAYGDYEAAVDVEARIVKAADRIQMLARALQYEAQHRGDVRRFWEGDGPEDGYGIPLAARVLARLRQMHERGEWYPSDVD